MSPTTCLLASILSVGLTACDKQDKPDPAPSGAGKPVTMTQPAKVLPASAVDFSSPTKVTQAVFAAAASGNLDQLKTLCDPKGEGDGDTRDICTMDASSSKLGEFKEYFAKGTTTSESIQGGEAEVGILFGPDGTKKETMKLVLRDDRWYLSSF